MWRFLLSRLLSALVVLLIVSLVTFGLIWLVPGDVASQMADPGASVEELARIRRRFNLDQPWHVQLDSPGTAICCAAILVSRFCSTARSTQAIIERLPVTLSLTLLALTIALVFGVSAGVVAAVRHGTWADQSVMTVWRCSGCRCRISGSASSVFMCSPWRSAGCRLAVSCRSPTMCSAGHARWFCPR